jgi:nicotinamidase-related amidase
MIDRRRFLSLIATAPALFAAQPSTFRLRLRKDSAEFVEKYSTADVAIIICDMWDNHWCSGAAHRVAPLAEKMNPVLAIARSHGIPIIHAPSETMDFYKDAPQRLAMMKVPKVEPPPPLDLPSPPLPIDDKSGGCDTVSDKFYKAWSRENPILQVADNDLISDSGSEVYSFLKQKGIRNLFLMGVHANMCILNRTFAIKQMTKWGIHCVLIRDLTDAMYNPGDRPFVSHQAGTELVIGHIEKYWCPSALSADFTTALQRTT